MSEPRTNAGSGPRGEACPCCRYDLSGLGGKTVCPECGRDLSGWSSPSWVSRAPQIEPLPTSPVFQRTLFGLLLLSGPGILLLMVALAGLIQHPGGPPVRVWVQAAGGFAPALMTLLWALLRGRIVSRHAAVQRALGAGAAAAALSGVVACALVML